MAILEISRQESGIETVTCASGIQWSQGQGGLVENLASAAYDRPLSPIFDDQCGDDLA